MDIQKIERISILVDKTFSHPIQDFSRPQTESLKNPWAKAPESTKEIAPHFSEAAIQLQQLDQQMDQIEKTASSLKEEMNTLQRTLPPFPPGSQERVRLLKSYVGLKKLIEQLTVPPEVPLDRFKEAIALPELGKQSTDQEWEAAIMGIGNTLEIIHQKKASLETGIEK